MGSSHAKLPKADREYIASMTNLTPKEVKKVYKTFLKKHPEGKIKKENLSREIEAWYNIQDVTAMETLVFETFDADKNGYIDFKVYTLLSL